MNEGNERFERLMAQIRRQSVLGERECERHISNLEHDDAELRLIRRSALSH